MMRHHLEKIVEFQKQRDEARGAAAASTRFSPCGQITVAVGTRLDAEQQHVDFFKMKREGRFIETTNEQLSFPDMRACMSHASFDYFL